LKQFRYLQSSLTGIELLMYEAVPFGRLILI
jgi:hypothetical protein